MKLRYKKTGEVYNACDIWFGESMDDLEKTKWKTLKEFCEDWEDVKEPLIKGEKFRKAVRAWAEANGTSILTFDGSYILTDEQMNDIEFGVTKPFEGLEKGKEYTIEELCGSMEE